MFEAVNRHVVAVGLDIHTPKAKVISVRITGEHHQAILPDDEPLKGVDMFTYPLLMFIANGQGIEEVRRKINLVYSAFSRLQSCLCSRREISLRSKGRVYQEEMLSI